MYSYLFFPLGLFLLITEWERFWKITQSWISSTYTAATSMFTYLLVTKWLSGWGCCDKSVSIIPSSLLSSKVLVFDRDVCDWNEGDLESTLPEKCSRVAAEHAGALLHVNKSLWNWLGFCFVLLKHKLFLCIYSESSIHFIVVVFMNWKFFTKFQFFKCSISKGVIFSICFRNTNKSGIDLNGTLTRGRKNNVWPQNTTYFWSYYLKLSETEKIQ